jgi:hypothetical protein
MPHRRRLPGLGAAAAFTVVAVAAAACAPGSGAVAPSQQPAASHDPSEVTTTIAGFVDAMQAGDGRAACAYLRDDEKQLFVSNAADVPDFADASASCEDVVAAFPTVAGARADDLDGSLQDISLAGDIATGSWVYRTGDQDVMLMHGAGGWQFAYHANDFPSALLHINE